MNTLDAMERLYSRKYGLVNSVNVPMENHVSSLKVPIENGTYTIGGAIPMFIPAVSRKGTTNGSGGAASLNRERSIIKTYGEFIERYGGIYNANEEAGNTLFDSFDNLQDKGVPCLDFRELIHYEEQIYDDPKFPLPRYKTSMPVTWVKGQNLSIGEDVWLPAQKIFLGYPYPADEYRYIWSLSTGLACGSNYYQAAQGAIYEVVERDSFMLTWLLQIPGKRIEMDSISNKELKQLYTHILKHLTGEDRLFIYDISKTPGVYTVLTFIRNDLPDAYGLVVAAASHTCPQVALLKSFEEMCQTQNFAHYTLAKDEKKECQHMKPQDVDSLHNHLFYYSTGRHSHILDFISLSGESTCLSNMDDYTKKSPKENLNYIVNCISQNGEQVYMADITKVEMRKSGFYVLKAVVPGYPDLISNHRFRQLNNRRLRKLQKELGAEINDNPHPFP